VLWGTTGTTQALAPAEATSATVGAMRILVGALALAGIAVAARAAAKTAAVPMPWRAPGLKVALVVGMAAIATYQVAFFGGVGRTGVAVGTVVGIGSAPVFTGLIELVVRGVRPERIWAVSTSLAVAGSALLVGSGGEARVDPVGVLLALGAGASYAVYTVACKALLDRGMTPVDVVAATFAGGALMLSPTLMIGDVNWVLTGRGLLAVVWLGGATVGVGYVLFARGLRLLPAATVATLTLAEPLTAASLGVIVLGERPGLLAVVGAVLVAAGLVLLAVRPRRNSEAATAAEAEDEDRERGELR
jgi:drug/metabolite transporter, DME family